MRSWLLHLCAHLCVHSSKPRSERSGTPLILYLQFKKYIQAKKNFSRMNTFCAECMNNTPYVTLGITPMIHGCVLSHPLRTHEKKYDVMVLHTSMNTYTKPMINATSPVVISAPSCQLTECCSIGPQQLMCSQNWVSLASHGSYKGHMEHRRKGGKFWSMCNLSVYPGGISILCVSRQPPGRRRGETIRSFCQILIRNPKYHFQIPLPNTTLL